MVHVAHVARAEPAVAKHVGRFFGLLPVARHDLRTANADFARVVFGVAAFGTETEVFKAVAADRHFGRGKRTADRAVPGSVRDVPAHARARFGEAVGFENVRASLRLPALRHGALHLRAAARRELQAREAVRAEGRVVEHGGKKRVDADDDGEVPLLDFLGEPLHVAGVRDEDARGGPARKADRRAEREDVVEGKRRHDDFLAFFKFARNPASDLLDVRDEIAVREDRALRDARRAARVLEERDVGVADLVRRETVLGPLGERRAEVDGVRKVVGGHHLLDAAHDEVDERALHKGEEIAHGRRHDVAAFGAFERMLERASEVFDDDDRLCAGVAQRVLHFARSVEGVHVHHDEARPQAGKEGDDVLQEVRHHDGHAVARLQVGKTLQIAREVARELHHAAIRNRHAHVDPGVAVGELLRRTVENGRDARIVIRIDFVRNVGGIDVEPGVLGCHGGKCPVERMGGL